MTTFSRKRKRIPLTDVKVSAAAIREVTATLREGWLSTGPRVKRFEQIVARRSGVPYAVAVNSATSGLFLALKALGVGPDSEVITTPLTFIATIETILHCGATPVLVDVEPRFLTIDARKIKAACTKKTAAVLAVDLAGNPCDYRAIHSALRGTKIPILSDSAHAFGAVYRGKPIPTVVDAAVYSFYATKNLTCGEGGMVVSRRRKLIDEVRLLSRHGIAANAFDRRQSGQMGYDVTRLGYKANLSDLHAALALGQLTTFERDQKRRAGLVKRYRERLAPLSKDFRLLPDPYPYVSSNHLLIAQLQPERGALSRDQFIRRMASTGIECGAHYLPVYEFSAYRWLAKGTSLPVCRDLAPHIVSLPLYAGMTMADVDYVCDRIAGLYG